MSVVDMDSRTAGTCYAVHAPVSNSWVTTVFSLTSERPRALSYRLHAASNTCTWFSVFPGMLMALRHLIWQVGLLYVLLSGTRTIISHTVSNGSVISTRSYSWGLQLEIRAWDRLSPLYSLVSSVNAISEMASYDNVRPLLRTPLLTFTLIIILTFMIRH